ncbi:MAG: peroxiredoxin [Candidatus Dormibacteria bacterium]|jgi:peroxiredoxin Q/BCP
MLKRGDQAPPFELQSGNGQTIGSEGLRGQRWVIYFYPRDNTPGCTIETREFGQALPEFARREVKVFGCSVGEVRAKAEFAAACGAPELPLLADTDHRVAEAFGVWLERERRGETFMAVFRATFLIGADGKVEGVWDSVRPEGHAAEVLAAVAGPLTGGN